jgi:thiol-disulfide isomerase/thioredoxin
MKPLKSYILLTFLFAAINLKAQKVEIIKWPQMEALLHQNNDTTYVINFWATWCRPCVAELPYFEELSKNYSSKKVKVILVSLDFSENAVPRVEPFLQKKNIQSKVVLLDEADPNSWIDKVSTKWSGAIPATIIKHGSKSSFYEQSFNYQQLDSIISIQLK